MFMQRKFIQMLLIILSCIFSICIGQINSPKKPQPPKQIQVIDDARAHELHQYLLDNKSIFKNHLILMSHPDYYTLLNEIIKKMDDIILYSEKQPIIDKTNLKTIGLAYEELHFINFNQLKLQIKNKIIKNKIISLNTTVIGK